MAERTTVVVCRDCGTTFEHVTLGNKPKLLCAPCGLEAQRKSTREHKRRKREAAKVRYTHCPDCGGEYDKPRARNGRCEACRKAYMRDYLRRYKAERAGPAPEFSCVTCARKIDRVGNSGKPLYCTPCALDAKRASALRSERKRTMRRNAKTYTHCHYCGDELPQPRRAARTPARCFRCKRQWHYAYMRNRTTRARFNPTCIDCNKPVHAKPKGPRRPRCGPCRQARQREVARVHAAVNGHVRRAKMRGLDAERFTKQSIFDRDGWRCGICRRRIPRHVRHPHPLSASLDHIVPLSKGGPHTRVNTRASHLRCNVRRNNRFTSEQLALFG